MEIETFYISGVNGHKIRCKYYHKENINSLAVFYPGLNYTTDAPFFYYLTDSVISNGYNLLALDFRYMEFPDFIDKNDAFRKDIIRTEGKIVYDFIINSLAYEKVLTVGKSLGTESIIGFLNNISYKTNHYFIWATPFKNHSKLADILVDFPFRSLFLWGTSDPYFSQQSIDKFKMNQHIRIRTFENAGHSFEVGHESIKSIEMLRNVICETERFIKELK